MLVQIPGARTFWAAGSKALVKPCLPWNLEVKFLTGSGAGGELGAMLPSAGIWGTYIHGWPTEGVNLVGR